MITTSRSDDRALLAIGLLLAVLLGFVLIGVGTLEFLIGAVLVGLIVATIIRPLVGLCVAAMFDLYFSYVQLFFVPPRNYFLAYLCLVAAARLCLKGLPQVGAAAKKILLPTLLLTTWAVVISFGYGDASLNTTYSLVGRLFAPLAIGLVTLYIVETPDDLRRFLNVVTVCLAISAFVAVMQFAGVEAFWKLRESIGLDEGSVVASQIRTRERVPGLAYFSIQLAYQLGSVIPLLTGLLMKRATLPRPRLDFVAAWTLMIVGLIASLTRSAIAGCLIGVGVVVFLGGHRRRLRWVAGLSALFAIAFISVDLIERRVTTIDAMMHGRWPLMLAAVRIAMSSPMGIGIERFSAYAEYYYSDLSHLPGAQQILVTASHNQFLNTLVYFGIPGLVLLVIVYFRIFQVLSELYRKETGDPYLQAVGIGLTGSFISYIVNSCFHNAGPFIGDPFNWYLIGLVMALGRMVERQERHLGLSIKTGSGWDSV